MYYHLAKESTTVHVPRMIGTRVQVMFCLRDIGVTPAHPEQALAQIYHLQLLKILEYSTRVTLEYSEYSRRIYSTLSRSPLRY